MSDLNNVKIGNVNVTVLEDGYLNLPKEVLKNIRPELEKTLTEKAETDLFFTHLHPDHVGGAINEDGNPVFVNASVKIPEKEIDFWNKDNFQDIDINGKGFADLAKSLLRAYDGKIIPISNEDEIIKNVHIVDLPGHTPGHSGFRIDDSNESFINLGDILHVPNIQLENPNISLLFDVDMEQGLKTRKMLFDMVSTDKLMCSGGHMLAPKFGFIEKFGTGYKFSK